MRVRNMTAGDYASVYALWLSCPGMGLNDRDDSREGVERFLLRNPETCFVAEEEGEIVGAILVGSDGRRAYVYHAAVHPAHRKRGIGQAMANAALEALRRIGVSKAALVVFARNEGGNAFWEKMGFTVREDLVYRNRALADLTRIDT